MICIAMLVTFAIVGCSTSSGTADDVFILASANYDKTDGPTILAEVQKDGASVENATVTVNGTQLSYGIPLTYEGVTLDTIPIYYSQMDFNPGDQLTIKATKSGESSPFYEKTVTVPAQVTMSQPTENQFTGAQDINVAWNASSNALFYYMSYYSYEDTVDNPYDEKTTRSTAKTPRSFSLRPPTMKMRIS